ncbi:MAG TPA: PmoA family protein [Thermomicrobiales bacterium]|jgi:hypothetical protein|nr:PmoA family protein [Thermomicrobiales bacterium]
MLVEHDIGRTIAISRERGLPPAVTLDYHSAPKSFMHPVMTPRGVPMTLIEPFDHTWHRGLWFTVKFVDGDNFWEEREPFGRQVLNLTPTIGHPAGDAVSVTMHIDWWMDGAQIPVLCERRTWTIRPGEDATVIDLDTDIIPTRDVTLDRTEYTTWGGYGGIAFRGSPSWHPDRRLLGDTVTEGRLLGEPGPWAAMDGPVDGGIDRTAGIALFDHPNNANHPTPWYTGSGAGNFLNAAFLFHGPMTLAKGDTLRLRYRLLVHDERWEADSIARRYDAWLVDEPDGDESPARATA